MLLESQEKLIPNFLGGGIVGGVETDGFEAGGGPQGMDGRFPDRPCDRAAAFGVDAAVLFLVDAVAVESDCIELASFVPSSCMLSREEDGVPGALCEGSSLGVSSLSVLGGVSTLSVLRAACSCTCFTSKDCMSEPRGVEGDEGGR